jgi:hypothetical protein
LEFLFQSITTTWVGINPSCLFLGTVSSFLIGVSLFPKETNIIWNGIFFHSL